MPDIYHRVGIVAPQKKVFDAISTIAGYHSWWDPTASGNPQKGGTLTFFKGVDMMVAECRPDELVKWKCVKGPKEWVDTEVIFQLRHEKGETFVLFTHADWKEPVEFMRHCSMKWAVFLLSLKDLIEKGKGQPHPDDRKVTSDN